jgi:hypothetical protein
VADKGTEFLYHYNAIQAWSVVPGGEVKNVGSSGFRVGNRVV